MLPMHSTLGRSNLRIGIDGRYIQDHFPGIGRYTYNLIQALAKAAPEDSFVLLYNPQLVNTRYTLERLKAPNVDLVAVNLPTFSLTEQYRLPSLICHLGLDLFHSPYYIKPYLLPCPSVVTIYDLIPRLYPQYISLGARVIFEIAIRLAAVTSRMIIAVSQSAKDDLVRLLGLLPSKVWVTPLGVDTQFKPLKEKAIFNLRHKYDLPEGYILYLGINKPHKNLVRLVEAFAKVKSGRKLVLAGREDPRYREVHEVVRRLSLQERVIFLGQVPERDLPALYCGAALFVLPSLYEGFGLPLLEAMACGVPVISSSISSLSEIAGRAAVTVDPMDVSQLARALEEVWGNSDLRVSMRQEGLKQAAHFSWERTAKETLMVYHQTLIR